VSTVRRTDDHAWLERVLGVGVRDLRLLDRALTHRSAAGDDNERLEFLGDAVLSFVVAERLYRAYGEASEGDLSRYRAALVSGETLADIGEAIGIGDHLRLGAGELRSGGFRRRSILADTFEALLGAVYLDQGLDAAAEVVERLWGERIAALKTSPPPKDAKTRLQEWLQGRGLGLPTYTVERITGEAHNQHFYVQLAIKELGVSTAGEGSSRRRAEQEAAELAIRNLPADGTPA
jgi:ribonuclease-3